MIPPTRARAPTKRPSPSREIFAAPLWFAFDKPPDDVPPDDPVPPDEEPSLVLALSGVVNGPSALVPFPVIDPICFPPVSGKKMSD